MRTKHQGLVKRLRKTFEACADVHSGRDMTDRLFTRMYCEERNITVLIMVDMSGSTKGWINDPERESLILLAESLQALGDRYAIYGYSGTSVSRTSARIKPGPQPARLETCVRICVEAWKKTGGYSVSPQKRLLRRSGTAICIGIREEAALACTASDIYRKITHQVSSGESPVSPQGGPGLGGWLVQPLACQPRTLSLRHSSLCFCSSPRDATKSMTLSMTRGA